MVPNRGLNHALHRPASISKSTNFVIGRRIQDRKGKMKVTVSIGPGPYDQALLDVLIGAQVETTAIRSWPDFVVEAWNSGEHTTVARHPEFGRLRRLTWALWRRIPWARRFETPRTALFSLFDRMARHYVDDCDLFVGWTQVSLLSIERAKRKGAVTLLEHPMVHVDTWMKIVTEEYATSSPGASGGYSLMPDAMVRRMRCEYEIADYISVCSSFAARTFLEAGLPRHKLVPMPLGVDTATFQPARRDDGPFRILYVGRLELCKGVQYLLQAFSRLKSEGAELWLVGPVMPEIRAILDQYAGEQVRVVGPVSQSELPAIYQQADVMVFPTVYDAFGLVITEAMACGIPVIATEHSAGPDVIEDGTDGFVIPIRDASAIEQKIRWLERHRARAREMGAAARAKAVSEFSLDQYGERLLTTYRGITSAKRLIRRQDSRKSNSYDTLSYHDQVRE
jgi:glycosyltransferase involved in cell wall biosynthesis